VAIAALAGTAGVGKTALATHWAHRVRDRFPDGQLHINLRGYSSSPPMRPIEALSQLIPALGVPADQVPVDLDQAAAMYRSLLSGKRMLVVLDNARSADQVRPLLPGAPGCLVLLTSRDRLAGLVARDGAHRIGLDVLRSDEADTLLSHVLGPERVAAEPEATVALAEACAYLPLALRIAAANLSHHPVRRIGDHVAELRAGNRLAALAVQGDEETAVRTAFDLSYLVLPEPVRRMFRLVGLVPGPDVTVPAAAALAGIPVDEAERLLDRLASGHLVTEHAPDRYGCHDLLRRYAAERAEQEDAGVERVAASARLHDFYRRGVDAAVDMLMPKLLRLPRPAPLAAHANQPADRTEAWRWLDSERPNLVAAVVAAAAAGTYRDAYLLADAMRSYFHLRTNMVDWLTVSRYGVASAQAAGDRSAESACELSLGEAYLRRRRFREAEAHWRQALALAEETGWLPAQAFSLNSIGIAYGMMGQLRPAGVHFRRALSINRQLGDRAGEAKCLGNCGFTGYLLGDLEPAMADYAAAVALHEQAGTGRGLAISLRNLAEVSHYLGHPEQARKHIDRALSLAKDVGDRGVQIESLRTLALMDRDTGHYPGALEHATAALDLVRDGGEDWLELDSLNTYASVLRRLRRFGAAREHHERAMRLARDTEARYAEIDALTGVGAATAGLGDDKKALADLDEAAERADRAGYRMLYAQALVTGAGVRRDEADARRALAVFQETGHRIGEATALLVIGAIGGGPECVEQAHRILDGYGANLAELDILPQPGA
jgi:tetratricopeptide (TPR) repeat protein